MYNEQIENLINAALADGVLTEKEKQILFKKAQAMGIDLDEFEMVLDARLVELKKKEAKEVEQHELEMEKIKAAQKSAPKSEKYGDVRKCPACGAMVESFMAKCPECGYEFTNVEGNNTVQKLLKSLDEIDREGNSVSVSTISKMSGNDKVTTRKVQLIQNFPIPNTKEDIIEMLTLCQGNCNPNSYVIQSDVKIANAWRSKTKQIIAKARLILKDDPDIQPLILDAEKVLKKKKWSPIKKVIVGIVAFVAIIIVLFIVLLVVAFNL